MSHDHFYLLVSRINLVIHYYNYWYPRLEIYDIKIDKKNVVAKKIK